MKRRFLINTTASLLLEIVSLICAFILPRLIITNFGSEYNGIVSSVSNFLAFITLLRGGVGGVTRAALYKPLHEKDTEKISGIMNATERFMRRISYIFGMFLMLFSLIYPFVVEDQFERIYTCSLVLILGISTFAQYYFGITYQILLQADQRNYVYSILQTGAVIMNTILSVILINSGIEFRMMKLVSSIVYCGTPIGLFWYVKKAYHLERKVAADTSAITQRWDAFAHQVAAFVNTNTDVMVLTLFTDLYYVSIYSVYFLVANGIKKFVLILFSNVEAIMGNILAKGRKETLCESLDIYEWTVHVVSIIAFSCTAILIVPFVMLYTSGVTDTNYNQPLFGCLLCVALFCFCVRLPYQNVIEAAGHFKETKKGAIGEAGLNIAVSIVLTIRYNVVGVVIGTIISTCLRTIEYAIYTSKQVAHRPIKRFVNRIVISILNFAAIGIVYYLSGVGSIISQQETYVDWIVTATPVSLIILMITIVINVCAYPHLIKQVYKIIKPVRNKV